MPSIEHGHLRGPKNSSLGQVGASHDSPGPGTFWDILASMWPRNVQALQSALAFAHQRIRQQETEIQQLRLDLGNRMELEVGEEEHVR